jgi:hypothetical protein
MQEHMLQHPKCTRYPFYQKPRTQSTTLYQMLAQLTAWVRTVITSYWFGQPSTGKNYDKIFKVIKFIRINWSGKHRHDNNLPTGKMNTCIRNHHCSSFTQKIIYANSIHARVKMKLSDQNNGNPWISCDSSGKEKCTRAPNTSPKCKWKALLVITHFMLHPQR